jgi:hypothetical protein
MGRPLARTSIARLATGRRSSTSESCAAPWRVRRADRQEPPVHAGLAQETQNAYEAQQLFNGVMLDAAAVAMPAISPVYPSRGYRLNPSLIVSWPRMPVRALGRWNSREDPEFWWEGAVRCTFPPKLEILVEVMNG